jgi:hypothetical protein
VLRYLDHLAPILDALEASLALPAISPVLEKRMFGYLELLAPILDTLESAIALPVVSECDVGMVRYGRGGFRPAESREQADPQRKEEAKNGPGLNCLRIAIVHESLQTWPYDSTRSLLRGQSMTS